MLSEVLASVKGVRFRSGVWAYFTARDRNRTEIELSKQHDNGTRAVVQELRTTGGVVYDSQPGRIRLVHLPPANAVLPRSDVGLVLTDILKAQTIAESMASGQLGAAGQPVREHNT
ncbi:hypothetical protein ABZ540_35350 [Nocardia xishanensis]|uniref:hypothetical protein n=1 Tax=Nocardia xishanensis TaxID=238964 RepID=UPI0033F3E22F